MPRGLAGTLIKLLIASLIVGFVLSALDITPASIVARLGGTVQGAVETGASLVGGAFNYVLLGALLVVPVWLIVVVVNSRGK